MSWLVSALMTWAFPLLAGSALGGIATAVKPTMQDFQRKAVELAPGSDQAAIIAAAEMAMRLLNLSGDEVLWPVHGRRHAQAGERIIPRYMVWDLTRGRAWFMESYTSARAARRQRFAGQRRGFARGSSFQLRQASAYAKG